MQYSKLTTFKKFEQFNMERSGEWLTQTGFIYMPIRRVLSIGAGGTCPLPKPGGGGTVGAPPLKCLLMLLHFIFISLMEIDQ